MTRDLEDHNPDEWGNIGKPEDFTKNNYEYAWTDSRKEEHKKRMQDPKWQENQAERNKKLAQDPEWHRKMLGTNPFHNIPGYAAEVAGRQWKDPARLEQHLQQIADTTARGGYKKDIQKKLNGAKARMQTLNRGKLVTPYGEFDSFLHFEVETEFTVTHAKDKLRLLPHLYYYSKNGPGETKYETVWHTPYGCAPHNLKRNLSRQAGREDFKQWFAEMQAKDPERYYTLEEPKRDWKRK